MDYRQIEVERRGRIGIIRLNRPRYRNAQSRLLLEVRENVFMRAEADKTAGVQHARAVIASGTDEQLARARVEARGLELP